MKLLRSLAALLCLMPAVAQGAGASLPPTSLPALLNSQGYTGASATALRPVTIPAALTFLGGVNLGALSIAEDPDRPAALSSRTSVQVFGDFSTALSAPGSTYYVGGAGANDNNACTTSALPCNTISKAVQLANAAGLPAKINVLGSFYYASSGFGGPSYIGPSVDIAYICYGGSPCITTTVPFGYAPTADATYPATYSQAVTSGIVQVADVTRQDANKHYSRLAFVASPAIANATPGTYACSAATTYSASLASCGTLYVHRLDGAAPVTANTRPYGSVNNFYLASQVSVYMGGSGSSQWQIEGGGGQNGPSIAYLSTPSTSASKHAIIFDHVSMRYGASGFLTSSYHGYAVCWSCDASALTDDMYSAHNPFHTSAIASGGSGYAVNDTVTLNSSAVMKVTAVSNGVITAYTEQTQPNEGFAGHAASFTSTQTATSGSGTGASFSYSFPNQVAQILLNSDGVDAGIIGGNVSVNYMTGHGNTQTLALGGYEDQSAGGSARFIGASYLAAVGTSFLGDRGDGWINGALLGTPRVLVEADGGSRAYLDGVRLLDRIPAVGLTTNSGGAIYVRNMSPYRLGNNVSGGTLAPWVPGM